MTRSITSIIVNNYNYGRFLPDAIESALNQTSRAIEVIVVDDGSTDNSRDIITGYGDRIIPVLKENGGQASAFTAGFNASSGDVVIFLDSDDMLLPTAVEEVADACREPGIVKVHWYLIEIDAAGNNLGTLKPGRALAEGNYRDVLVDTGPFCFVSPPTSGNAWSRWFLEKVMPIQECGDRHGADAYLFVLAALFGDFKAISHPLGKYRVHANNFSGHTLAGKIRRDARRFDHHVALLQRTLQTHGIHPNVDRWRQRSWSSLAANILTAMTEAIPEGSEYILVDLVGWSADILAGRKARPFLERDGIDFGPPPDSQTAIAELERMRREGTAYILFPETAFWWMKVYPEFLAYLHEHYRKSMQNDFVLAFDLRSRRLPDSSLRNTQPA